jgi:hypothetical protein
MRDSESEIHCLGDEALAGHCLTRQLPQLSQSPVARD